MLLLILFQEEPVEGYETTIEGSNTNSRTPEVVEIPVAKSLEGQ